MNTIIKFISLWNSYNHLSYKDWWCKDSISIIAFWKVPQYRSWNGYLIKITSTDMPPLKPIKKTIASTLGSLHT